VLSDADRAVPCLAFRRAGNSVALGRYYLIGVFGLTTRLGHSENVTIAAKEVSAPCRGRRWRSAIFGSNVRDHLATTPDATLLPMVLHAEIAIDMKR
jgi:hypothetical protein